ncbi:MAG: cell envelope integrity protein CreD [Saprospiraceae bacterium]
MKQITSSSLWSGWTMTFKLIGIFFLTLLLLIPRFMLTDLVSEREALNNSVCDEVSSSWAKDQLITGPYLIIPYWEYAFDSILRQKKNYYKLIIMPEELKIEGSFTTNEKNRSLYKVMLYETKLNFSGNFKIPDLKELNILIQQINWNDAFISCSISDPKGISTESYITIDSSKIRMNPGMLGMDIQSRLEPSESPISNAQRRIFNYQGPSMNGLSAHYPILNPENPIEFSLPIDLKGSRSLLFSPVAQNTSVTIRSAFASPSFIGEFLPQHDLSDKGFTANWKILDYNKSIPHYYNKTNTVDLGNNLFGMNIQNPVNHYSKTDRACKYLILFIIITFLAVFLTEIIHKIKVHIFQYSLVGLALTIFFALLLSISEFLTFNLSYAISAIAITIMIYIYSLSIFQKINSSYLLSFLIISFFSFMFIIIQLEKVALLFGTIMLFIMLGLTMFITRKINWYEQNNDAEDRIVY